MDVLFSLLILTSSRVMITQTENYSLSTERSQNIDSTLDHHVTSKYQMLHTEKKRSVVDAQDHTEASPIAGSSLGHTKPDQNAGVLAGDGQGNVSIAYNTEDYRDTSVSPVNTVIQSIGLSGHTEGYSTTATSPRTESYQSGDTTEGDRTVSRSKQNVTDTNVPRLQTFSTTSAPAMKPFRWVLKQNGYGVLRFNLQVCTNHFNYVWGFSSSYNLTLELLLDTSHLEQADKECIMTVSIPKELYFNLTVDRFKETPDGNFTLTISEVGSNQTILNPLVVNSTMLKNNQISLISFNSIRLNFESHAPHEPFVLKLHYLAQKNPYVGDLPFEKVSTTVFYLTSPGFTEDQSYPNNYDGEFSLTISDGDSLLISFRTIIIEDSNTCADYIGLTEVPANKTKKLCGKDPLPDMMIYHSSLRLHFHSNNVNTGKGFKMMFAVLPRWEEPKLLQSKVFNCSVPHFNHFKPLLNCNALKECEGGEDEQDCWFRSKECGEDFFDVGNKCYRLERSDKMIEWNKAHVDCIRKGQKLATFRTVDEFKQFTRFINTAKNMACTFLGAQTVIWQQPASVAMLYKYVWQWIDGHTAFSIAVDRSDAYPSCVFYRDRNISVVACNHRMDCGYTCAFEKQGKISKLETEDDPTDRLLISSGDVLWNVSVTQCPSRHFTRDFLSCDSESECNGLDSLMLCATNFARVPMFKCQQSKILVPYSLVCDHMRHCPDNSDESFCQHPSCPFGFDRDNQCVLKHQQCDGSLDTYDGSDETCLISGGRLSFQQPPGSVYLDGKGGFRIEPLNSDSCPSTHFLCPEDFCLPVYLRCNSIVDCPGREDEAGCDSYTCPGFYRCRGSKVCLHADNVCDGVPQCPEQDDELLCDLSCPDQCHCQGLAFVCSTNFSASSYPALRYLDASGSGMTPGDLTDNLYLIHLRLSDCGIIGVSAHLGFSNLQKFDLSWNTLTQLDMHSFRSLFNLRILVLTGNPLKEIVDSASSEQGVIKLSFIDLSYTDLNVFNASLLTISPELKQINISHSKITTITDDGFQFTPKLEIFDSTGSRLRYFSKGLLRDLAFLKIVLADDYRLCCETILPINFNLRNCQAGEDLFASCKYLLRSNLYRVFLWVFASLSIFGNITCFVARLYHNTEGKTQGSISVFITNLSFADFLMGAYLTVISVADLDLNGKYLWHDDEWKNSIACNVAGFLFLLSSEVSALMICFATLDRIIVHLKPRKKLHFGPKSALMTCGIVWLGGVTMAAVPLLPMTSHWEFYNQSSICIPLPFTNSNIFPGNDYYFCITIPLNLICLILMTAGQAYLCWSIPSRSLSSSATNLSKDSAVALRLNTIVMSNFLRLFSVGLLGVLAAAGIQIPSEVGVNFAIFVLPFNSALNPILYIFNVVTEKRKQSQETHLLNRLRGRGQTKTSVDKAWDTSKSQEG